jgi:hypothetical protein
MTITKPLILIPLATLLMALHSAPYAASSSVNYFEDFQDGEAQQWETDGYWSINPSKPNFTYEVYNKTLVPSKTTYLGESFSDFKYTAWTKSVAGAMPAYLIFRASSNFSTSVSDSTAYGYGFGINPKSSKFYIFRTSGGSTKTLAKWVKSDSINGSAAWNKLSVYAVDANLKFYVNDELVYSYTDAQPIPSGFVGLMVAPSPSTKSVVQFDKISVKPIMTTQSAH